MLPASVAAAVSAVMLSVVVTAHIRIVIKLPFQKRLHRRIRIAGYAAVKPDPDCRQRILRACSDTAADQGIHLIFFQKSCQRPVSVSVCVHNFGRYHVSVLHVIHFELLRMSEMLKNLSIFVSYTNFHRFLLSFSF